MKLQYIQTFTMNVQCTYMFYSLFESLRDFPNFVLKSPRPGELSFLFLKIPCHSIFCLKETVSRDFQPIVLLKRFHLGPYEQAKTVWQTFSYCEDIQSQSSKIACPRSQRLLRPMNFSLDTNVLIFLNYCFWVCKHTQVPFSPDSSFKICEKPSMKFESVCVVLSEANIMFA